MNIQIQNHGESRFATYFTVNVEGQDVSIGVYKDGRVSVLVHNQMHKIYRGMGKTYDSFDAALGKFKSAKALAAINAVKTEVGK